MPHKPLITKEDYFKLLDDWLKMPGMPGISQSSEPVSLLGRIRQAVQKRGLPKPKG